MKKIILGLVIALVLNSCTRERDEFYSSYENCECGRIANDGITGDDYWIEVRNDCTGNKKKFYMDADLWMDAHIGEIRCYGYQW